MTISDSHHMLLYCLCSDDFLHISSNTEMTITVLVKENCTNNGRKLAEVRRSCDDLNVLVNFEVHIVAYYIDKKQQCEQLPGVRKEIKIGPIILKHSHLQVKGKELLKPFRQKHGVLFRYVFCQKKWMVRGAGREKFDYLYLL